MISNFFLDLLWGVHFGVWNFEKDYSAYFNTPYLNKLFISFWPPRKCVRLKCVRLKIVAVLYSKL